MNDKIVLICGGSGMIGQALCTLLTEQGYKPRILTRSKSTSSPYEQMIWDPAKSYMEPGALHNIYGVINLAGASIGHSRWSKARKLEIAESRIVATRFIVQQINSLKILPQVFISTSASGIYGDHGHDIIDESTPVLSKDFLSGLCKEWESEADKIDLKVRKVILRIGLVLSTRDGILSKSILPARMGLAPCFGSGQQIYSWIHIDDLASIFCMALEDQAAVGIYNAVSNHPVLQMTFAIQVAKALKKNSFVFHLPRWLMRLLIGEFSEALFTSQHIIPSKLNALGFQFKYDDINNALEDLLSK